MANIIFEEALHPRAPRGSPTGGQFVGKGGGASVPHASERVGALYHVTLTKNVPSIRRDGIRRFETSNWVRAGDRSRYGEGEIYAFEHEHDAQRWAAKMDWDFHQQTGSGKVSIVKINPQTNWSIDESDPLAHAGAKGRWLKSLQSVPPQAVISATQFDSAAAKKLVADINVGREETPEDVDAVSDWRTTPEPKVKIKGYKTFEIDDNGNLYPAMVREKRPIPVGKWLVAEFRGKDPRLKERPGWHMSDLPMAPQLRSRKTGKMSPTRVWAEVEMGGDAELHPGKDGLLGEVPKPGEFYTHKQGRALWKIGGAVRITRILYDPEVADILTKAGRPADAAAEQNGRIEKKPQTPAEEPVTTPVEDNELYRMWNGNGFGPVQDARWEPNEKQDFLSTIPDERSIIFPRNASAEQLQKLGTQFLMKVGWDTQREHAVAVRIDGPDEGREVAIMEGTDHYVHIPDPMIKRYSEGDEKWAYDHYHPSLHPLSNGDIGVLHERPGMASITAHNPDGGWSKATIAFKRDKPPSREMAEKFRDAIGHAYGRVKAHILRADVHERLSNDAKLGGTIKTFLAIHAKNIALAKHKLIDYQYKLSEQQQRWVDENREVFDECVAAAARTGLLKTWNKPTRREVAQELAGIAYKREQPAVTPYKDEDWEQERGVTNPSPRDLEGATERFLRRPESRDYEHYPVFRYLKYKKDVHVMYANVAEHGIMARMLGVREEWEKNDPDMLTGFISRSDLPDIHRMGLSKWIVRRHETTKGYGGAKTYIPERPAREERERLAARQPQKERAA